MLRENIQDVAVLIHRSPQVVTCIIDGEKDLIEVPFVTWPRAPMPEFIRIGWAELAAPLPDGFIGHSDPTDEQELFHIAVAETGAEVQPDRHA
jgi:hypothetical protein